MASLTLCSASDVEKEMLRGQMVSLMTQEDVRALQQDDISINKELVKLTPNHEEKKGMTRGTKTSDT